MIHLFCMADKKALSRALDKYPEIKQMCKIKHCDKVIQMGDKPSQSIKGREKLKYVEFNRKR